MKQQESMDILILSQEFKNMYVETSLEFQQLMKEISSRCGKVEQRCDTLERNYNELSVTPHIE